METRPVAVYEWYRPDDAAYNAPFTKRFVGDAKFHQFGVDYEQFDSGVGNFTVAIVEMYDGSVMSVPVDLIKFADARPHS